MFCIVSGAASIVNPKAMRRQSKAMQPGITFNDLDVGTPEEKNRDTRNAGILGIALGVFFLAIWVWDVV